MAKKIIKQDEEWGNIELPGLSDEKLLSTNWNLVEANRQVAKDRIKNGWAEKNAHATRNRKKGWSDTISETAKKTRSKEGWKEGFLETIKQRNDDPNYQNKLKEGIAKRTSDPNWLEKNRKASEKKFKKIQTPEGLFNSVKDAIDYYNILRNSKYSESWLLDQRKKHPDKFYIVE